MVDGNGNPPQPQPFRRRVQTDGRPRSTQQQQPFPAQVFQDLPPASGQAPYHLDLGQVVDPQVINTITTNGHLVFHLTGDTGGVKSPQPQQIVADHMVADFNSSDPASNPAFFYHVGDVVYFYGETDQYYGQFYEPYEHYGAPILAIPGNHDGDVNPSAPAPSLQAFVNNFCSTTGQPTPESQDSGRPAMVQPNVYWTLEAPFLTIIGLYTNVPEHGVVHQDQADWFQAELQNAPQDKALLVALHHPPYSLDQHHSGSQPMLDLLDNAFQASGRIPDAVFTGHVHNYQRFTRRMDEREVPFIVAGAGGYWHLHYMQKQFGQPIVPPYTPQDNPDVTLEQFVDDRHGYLRLQVWATGDAGGTATPTMLRGEYLAVPRPHEPWRDPAEVVDTFTVDLRQHKLLR